MTESNDFDRRSPADALGAIENAPANRATASTPPAARGAIEPGHGGFWRLRHEDLAAALARRDLTGEQLRVYLALADLTHGFGRDRDTVSLGQIAQQAGGMRRPHVVRALHSLAERGLYGQRQANGKSVLRSVVWPAPPVPAAGNTSSTVPTVGSSTVPTAGNGTVLKAVPTDGNHQDHQELNKRKKSKCTTGKPPPDPRVKCFIDWFCQTYGETLGRPYVVNGGKDGATVKRLLKSLDAAGDGRDALAELERATANMLADLWAGPRADIGLLAGKINTWLGEPAQPGRRSERDEHHYDQGF